MALKKKVICILASRYNSSRLKGKAMLPMASESSMLSLIIKRLKSSSVLDDVIIATTKSSISYFEPTLNSLNTKYYIGDEENVLSRYVSAADLFNADIIVRATGDNPLVSIKALDMIVCHHIKTNADLSHFNAIPYGSGVEVIEYSALKKSLDNSKDSFEQEHITQYIYRHKDNFKIENPDVDDEFNMPNLITTVDTIEQYENVQKIFKKYNDDIYIDVDKIIADIRNEK